MGHPIAAFEIAYRFAASFQSHAVPIIGKTHCVGGNPKAELHPPVSHGPAAERLGFYIQKILEIIAGNVEFVGMHVVIRDPVDLIGVIGGIGLLFVPVLKRGLRILGRHDRRVIGINFVLAFRNEGQFLLLTLFLLGPGRGGETQHHHQRQKQRQDAPGREGSPGSCVFCHVFSSFKLFTPRGVCTPRMLPFV